MTHSRSVADLRSRFPDNFIWGVATSAFQIEGAACVDGRGPSIWDEFCTRPGAIADGSNGNVACDHYHRLESDLDLIASLGVNAYRFSIAWPRVQPQGIGALNEKGMAFYESLVDGLLRRNIKPFVTLYHWDLPAYLQERQLGWQSRDTAYRFAEYAALVGRRLGDRVESIATHNEPWVTAVLGHELGIFAPGTRDRRAAYQVAHHVLLSHGLATQAIRALNAKAEVGIVLNMSPISPATDSEPDQRQARLEDGCLVRWYADALLKGEYPADIREFLRGDAPRVEPDDAATIAQSIDFLGINYYHPTVSSSDVPVAAASEGAVVTQMGWEVAPHSLTALLLRLQRDYTLPPILITENGAAFHDEVVEGRIEDEDRRAYIEAHIAAVADAMRLGVDVQGYFVWSLMDNFEWAQGYARRFGLVHVDYATLKRTVKRSGLWYRALVQADRPADIAARPATDAAQ